MIKYFSFFYFLAICCLFCFCEDKKKNLPFYNDPTFEPIFLSADAEIEKKISHKIKDFSFLDQEDSVFSQKNIEGKIHIANFIFTSCGNICPVMTENLQKIVQPFDNDNSVVFVSYSVMPQKDTPNKLRQFKKQKNIQKKNWYFITGNQQEIYHLARKSYFAEEDLGFTKNDSSFLHTEHVLLVDKDKRIRGIYNGTLLLDMQQLAKDILVLKEEK